jgi:serine/threonine protein kinase
MSYYEMAANGNDSDGCFHCALACQYGISVDVDFETAASHYVRSFESRLVIEHSFRCLRSLNQARIDARQVSKRRRRAIQPPDDLRSTRPFGVATDVTSYLRRSIGKDGDRVIGMGGFSTVTLTFDPKTKQRIAVKHLRACQDQVCLFQEVESLARLNHPCVVRIVGWSPPDGCKEAEIHMEYAENKSLKEALHDVNLGRSPTFWNATGIGIIISGLVLGMRFVHSRGIIHRDLKPSNVLLGREGRVLIADFGTSHNEYEDRTPVGAGTVYYAAPEMVEEDGDCTVKCDVFTFGLILYEILAHKPVFEPNADPPLSVLRRLRAGDFAPIPDEWGTLFVNLIRSCWQKDPAKRPSFNDIFDDLQAAQFAIVPGGNANDIRHYCQSVLTWEMQNAAIGGSNRK